MKIYFHKYVVEWLLRYLPDMFRRYYLDYINATTYEMRRKDDNEKKR